MYSEITHKIVEDVIDALESMGYKIEIFGRYCFDIAASRKENGYEKKLLIKTLLNVDSFDINRAREIKEMSGIINAKPCIIGVHGRNFSIRQNVVYSRFEIPVMSPETFSDSISEHSSIVFSRKGKSRTFIDPGKLKNARIRNCLSMDDVSGELGISKKTLFMAEKHGFLSEDIACALEDFFGEVFREPVDFFSMYHGGKYCSDNNDKACGFRQKQDIVENKIISATRRIGYTNYVFESLPSNLVSKSAADTILCGVVKNTITEKHAYDLAKLGDFCSFKKVIISEKSISLESKDIACITTSEICRIKTREDLLDLISERV